VKAFLENNEERVNRNHYEIRVRFVWQCQKYHLNSVALTSYVLVNQLFGVLEDLADEIRDFDPELALAYLSTLNQEA